jgi:hypothetical protein
VSSTIYVALLELRKALIQPITDDISVTSLGSTIAEELERTFTSHTE